MEETGPDLYVDIKEKEEKIRPERHGKENKGIKKSKVFAVVSRNGVCLN